jgi:hypothetical protein
MVLLGTEGPASWTPAPLPTDLELMYDVSAARWVEESLAARPWATVGSFLPGGFDAYARILHPAYADPQGLEPIRWTDVAARTGATVHPRMQFARIAGLGDDPNEQPPWGTRPHEGSFERADLLISALRPFTTAPKVCWFCLWEGFGGLDQVPELEGAPRVSVPGRKYLLFRGPLDAYASFGAAGAPWDEAPSIWWPDDRAWCVACDIDLDSTYVGGTGACIEAILADDRFEAFYARLEDRLDSGADEING